MAETKAQWHRDNFSYEIKCDKGSIGPSTESGIEEDDQMGKNML